MRQLLKRVSKDRAILLTTHSMEEAETLASKVAIISTRMRRTLSSLQEKYGDLYKSIPLDSIDKCAAGSEVRAVVAHDQQ